MEGTLEQATGNVLIVEDDPAIRESLGQYLTHRGLHVEAAHSGHGGLKRLADNRFDVVISDVMMPGMNGIAFMEEALKADPELSIVMITGYADVRVAIEAMKKGAEEFILKPFQFEDVWRVLQNMIRRRQKKKPAPEPGKAEATLERKVRELSNLYTITEGLAEAETEMDVFQFLVDVGARIAGGNRAMFFVGDPDDGHHYLRSRTGVGGRRDSHAPIVFDPDLVDRIVHTVDPRVMSDEDADLYRRAADGPDAVDTPERIMVAPLVVRGELFGILSIHRPVGTTTFDAAEANFVQILLKKAALHIENTALYESLYNNLVNTLNSLVQAIEAKDPYTRLHSQRVTLFACGIAETLGLGEREMEALRFASPLHDIGKIGISDAILLKNGRPTEEEFAAIRRHPELGAKILEPLGLLADEQSIILYHHERWDGRGYPAGLAGGDIPLLARIVTVADAYDAMTSDRIYRRARSHATAMEELLAHSARQFDPAVVEGFVRYAETMSLR